MKALCDQMLGTLAKWLRLFGFDTFYANSEMEDEELLQVAKKEDRVIITRDKQLIARGKKEKLPVIEMNTTDLDEQLNLVLKNVDIDQKAILSRCSVCNTILDKVKKSEVKNKVPKKVFENNEKFWFCSKCDKFYWMGTHYDKIIKKIDEVKKLQNG
jgi:uncharacterized protein with PIN domain